MAVGDVIITTVGPVGNHRQRTFRCAETLALAVQIEVFRAQFQVSDTVIQKVVCVHRTVATVLTVDHPVTAGGTCGRCCEIERRVADQVVCSEYNG